MDKMPLLTLKLLAYACVHGPRAAERKRNSIWHAHSHRQSHKNKRRVHHTFAHLIRSLHAARQWIFPLWPGGTHNIIILKK
jgi:hypothetical protein